MRPLIVLALAAWSATASAEILYWVQPLPDGLSGRVDIVVPNPGEKIQFQIPNWAPGSYRLVEYRDRISGVVAYGTDRRVLKVERADPNTWTVNTGGDKSAAISYVVPMPVRNEVGHYPGPGIYMYVLGRKTENIRLELNLEPGWRSSCGLDARAGRNVFSAPDYDVLADNPVTFGKFEIDRYTVENVPHEIVYHTGNPALIDRKAVIAACRHITRSQSHFWGGLPFKKYVWHFNVNEALDGAGGLEHLSSTEISLGSGVGPGVISVLSHELFHAWNVKRIRSKVLGPFDYLVLPKTGAIWWLEGVTDYYANLLLHRYGFFPEDSYLQGSIARNVQRTRANENRFQISPYDSSYRVGEAANGRGNSQGYLVNYYNTGWLAGFCLDVELRHRTGGKKSLDTISQELYRICRDNRPGFEEDAIRQLLLKHGGAEFGDIYQKWIRSPGELPVEEQLAKIGWTMANEDVKTSSLGVNLAPSNGKVRILGGAPGSTLQSGDGILSVGPFNFEPIGSAELAGQVRRLNAWLKEGMSVRVRFRRGDVYRTVTVSTVTRTAKQWVIREAANPTKQQLALRRGLSFANAPKIPKEGWPAGA